MQWGGNETSGSITAARTSTEVPGLAEEHDGTEAALRQAWGDAA